jgi:hypothetical protein
MKKKLTVSLIISTVLIAIFAMSTSAASAASHSKTASFDGTFSGVVEGDKGTDTVLTLDLEQDGRDVAGTVSLGRGLKVDAGGFCGVVTVPATTIQTGASVSSRHPRDLSTASKVDVGGGITVKIVFDGELSADNETLDVTATIDTPFLCGRDPVITGTLTKL